MAEEIIYERTINFERHSHLTVLRLVKVPGVRNYRADIKGKDNLVLIEIEQWQECPTCKNKFSSHNRVAYSFPDQTKMWGAVFRIKQLRGERVRQIEELVTLINNIQSDMLVTIEKRR